MTALIGSAFFSERITPVGSTETRAVDVRIVSATSRNLQEEIARHAFREDLYHRINVLTIAVPPLRARRDDIPDLAAHFLHAASNELGVRPRVLSPAAVDYLMQLSWPGNVRELRNLMERIVVICPKEVIGAGDVVDAVRLALDRPGATAPGRPLREARAHFERQYILDRIAANHGNLGAAARELGIERTNLYRKMRQLGIGAVTRGRLDD